MRQRNDGSFGFNSWRVEENEQRIMNMYLNQEIDLIKKIESFKEGRLIYTKTLELSKQNLWRLSRLKRNYGASFLTSNIQSKIHFLANFKDDEFDQGFKEMNIQ